MAGTMNAVLALVVVAAVLQSVSAATHKVDWTFQTTDASFYDDWAAKETFLVGDKLTFTYAAGAHNVYQVSVADAAACDGTNPIKKYEAANPTITLTKAGTQAFICELPGHCGAGMTLKLTVAAAPTAPSTGAPVEGPTAGPVEGPTAAPLEAPAAGPVEEPTAAESPLASSPAALGGAPAAAPSASSSLRSGAVAVVGVFVAVAMALAM